MEKNKIEIMNASEEVVENDIMKLTKTYKFEGKEYSELDFSKLENLDASDMIAANKVLERTGSITLMPEMSLEYILVISSRATGLPVEFFKQLHPRDAIRIKNKVTGFFYGEE